jgi:hypothetical protein
LVKRTWNTRRPCGSVVDRSKFVTVTTVNTSLGSFNGQTLSLTLAGQGVDMLAICKGACLTWSNDCGWCVVDSVAPAEDNVRCHRLLGLASARPRFWLYRDPGGADRGPATHIDRTPPTPPGMRVRTGRFKQLRSIRVVSVSRRIAWACLVPGRPSICGSGPITSLTPRWTRLHLARQFTEAHDEGSDADSAVKLTTGRSRRPLFRAKRR